MSRKKYPTRFDEENLKIFLVSILHFQIFKESNEISILENPF
jgi:hypothetical protein